MNQSTTKDPQPSSPEDHSEVFSMWNSDEMQKRLEDARVKRAKIIAARQAEMTDLAGQQGGAVKSISNVPAAVRVADDAIEPPSAKPAAVRVTDDAIQPPSARPAAVRVADDDASEPPLARPAKPLPGVQKNLQVKQKSRRQSRASGLVAGMAFGLALGAGAMWISENGMSGLSTPIDTFNGLTGWNVVADNSAVDPVPPTQTVAEEAFAKEPVPADPPADLALPAPPDPDRLASKAPVDETSLQVPSDPSVERQTLPLTADQVPVRRQYSSSSVTALPTDDQPALGTVDQMDPPVIEDVQSQVILHVSPDISQRVYDDVQSTIDTAGLDVAETSIAGFAVLESEVRFFHPSDAQSAQRIADDMRIKVRDFSTFRPAPERGTLEVWLARDG